MTFDVPTSAYDRYIGRYSRVLAPRSLAFAGVSRGPAGGYLAAQTEARRSAIREACFELLGEPSGPFSLPARALAIRGRA